VGALGVGEWECVGQALGWGAGGVACCASC